MKIRAFLMLLAAAVGIIGLLYVIVFICFPPTMILQEINTNPKNIMGYAAGIVSPEKQNKVYKYYMTLIDTKFDASGYREKFPEDVCIESDGVYQIYSNDLSRPKQFIIGDIKVREERYKKKARKFVHEFAD